MCGRPASTDTHYSTSKQGEGQAAPQPITSFSLCTDSSHELRDLQHLMSEQIDLHVFKAITAASCVDIIVNKRLIKLAPYNS